MKRRSKISYEEKIQAVQRYINGLGSFSTIAKEISVDKSSLQSWVNMYKHVGAHVLLTTSQNTTYSRDLKIAAVKEYFEGNASLRDIQAKYVIRSHIQLLNWIRQYNGHEAIKSSQSGGALMTKRRKTTLDERIEIVKYCIEHNRDYNETAQHYKVSYQQVYSWTQKYESSGVEALQDRRGKNKPEDQMSELEKLRAQNKLLEAENRRKQMEIDFLKKLEEIERRRS
jgi:transposase-like protein